MKFAMIIDYVGDREKVRSVHTSHRQYLRGFLDNGQLFAAGPFAENAGALRVIEAATAEEAEEIVAGDPSVAAGVFVKWQIRPLAYWSAKEVVGA